MASQWNEEFLSHFTPGVHEGSTEVRADDERLIFMRSTDEAFVDVNEDRTDMQELDLLMMRNDLVTKASDGICQADAQPVRHASVHEGFDGSELSLVTSDSSLSIHADQSHLEHFLSQHTTPSSQHPPSILSVDENQPHLHQQQQKHINPHHHPHDLEESEEEQSPPALLLARTLAFDSSDPHALVERGMCHDSSQPLHLPQQQTQTLSSPVVKQISQAQLPCQEDHPIASFHLNEHILDSSSLTSKLSSLVTEQNSRTDECSSSFSSPTTTLPFLSSSAILPAIIRNLDVTTPASSPVALTSNPQATSVRVFDTSSRKGKKNKTVNRTCGDMVWLNNKSLQSRQRDRQATQTLIEIVSSPRWRAKLNSDTVKKRIVWREIGEEFISKGYFLENPGKKCFQKWRNLERTFKDYELSKKTPFCVTKSVPDFYDELRPILLEKLSLNGLLGEKGDKVINDRLMEKYIDFDCNSSTKAGSIDSLSMPAFSPGPKSNDGPQTEASTSRSSMNLQICTSDERRFSKLRKIGCSFSGKATKPLSTDDVADGLKSQQQELSQMNSALQSIKHLLEEQRRARERTEAESKARFLELKAMVENNHKEKMSFMYTFLKSVQENQKQISSKKT